MLEAEQQDFIARIGDFTGLPTIRHVFEVKAKNCRLGQSLEISSTRVHRNPPLSESASSPIS
jgi:hypothetical protein